MFLEVSQNSQEKTCARASWNFNKKETLARVFSCEFCGISKNIFFTEHFWATASIKRNVYQICYFLLTNQISLAGCQISVNTNIAIDW